MQSIILKRPITKKELSDPKLMMKINNECKHIFLEKYVSMAISQISWQIINHNTNKDKIFSLDVMRGRKMGNFQSYLNEVFSGRENINPCLMTSIDIAPFPGELVQVEQITKEETNETLDKIVNGLKELFPDSLIQIDPKKTYIYVDWN
jgi:hypothetical protein